MIPFVHDSCKHKDNTLERLGETLKTTNDLQSHKRCKSRWNWCSLKYRGRKKPSDKGHIVLNGEVTCRACTECSHGRADNRWAHCLCVSCLRCCCQRGDRAGVKSVSTCAEHCCMKPCTALKLQHVIVKHEPLLSLRQPFWNSRY